jgi:hypothetical protein
MIPAGDLAPVGIRRLCRKQKRIDTRVTSSSALAAGWCLDHRVRPGLDGHRAVLLSPRITVGMLLLSHLLHLLIWEWAKPSPIRGERLDDRMRDRQNQLAVVDAADRQRPECLNTNRLGDRGRGLMHMLGFRSVTVRVLIVHPPRAAASRVTTGPGCGARRGPGGWKPKRSRPIYRHARESRGGSPWRQFGRRPRPCGRRPRRARRALSPRPEQEGFPPSLKFSAKRTATAPAGTIRGG